MTTSFETVLTNLAALCAGRATPAWLVGGAARDLARGLAPADLDLAVAGDGLALARAFADAYGAAFVPLDRERQTGRAVIPGPQPLTVDIAALRAPTIEGDLRLRDFTLNALALPLTDGGAADAQRHRLAPNTAWLASDVGCRPSLIDPTGGLADLEAGVLRAAGPSSLTDDPLRVLRAGRLVATLGLDPAPELAEQLRSASPGLDHVAAERVRDELLKLLDAPAAPALRYLDGCGALTRVLPELEPARACEQPRVHFLPVLAHILETVAALDWLIMKIEASGRAKGPATRHSLRAPAPPVAVRTRPDLVDKLPYDDRLAALLGERRAGGHRRAALLKLAALLHDNAKPQTKELHGDGTVSFHGHQELGAEAALRIARRLRLSRADSAYVALVVREHMRPGQLRTAEVITLRAVTRFFRDLGDAGPDVLIHELADHLATRGPRISAEGWAAHLAWVEAMLAHYYTPPPVPQAPLIDGHSLMTALQIGPGPLVGRLLREIAEAQAAGEVSTAEEALTLAREQKLRLEN
jgi:poly(A) polymerase/tRNA nucleotidyltransferase (CCA-adding enzyme)